MADIIASSPKSLAVAALAHYIPGIGFPCAVAPIGAVGALQTRPGTHPTCEYTGHPRPAGPRARFV